MIPLGWQVVACFCLSFTSSYAYLTTARLKRNALLVEIGTWFYFYAKFPSASYLNSRTSAGGFLRLGGELVSDIDDQIRAVLSQTDEIEFASSPDHSAGTNLDAIDELKHICEQVVNQLLEIDGVDENHVEVRKQRELLQSINIPAERALREVMEYEKIMKEEGERH